MTGVWFISYLVLWLMVIALLIVVITLARQIGLLHRRLRPHGARMTNAGPEIGEQAPELKGVTLQGRNIALESCRDKQTLLVFVSPTCTSCAELAPALRSIWKSERTTLQVFLVSLSGDEKANREFIARHKLVNIPCIVSRSLGLQYNVTSSPYGVLIDNQGVVRAKGIVNHLEHLESLLNAANMEHASWEDLLRAHQQDEAMATNTTRQ